MDVGSIVWESKHVAGTRRHDFRLNARRVAKCEATVGLWRFAHGDGSSPLVGRQAVPLVVTDHDTVPIDDRRAVFSEKPGSWCTTARRTDGDGRTRSGTRVVLRMGPVNECAWDRTYRGGTESRLCRFVLRLRGRAHGCASPRRLRNAGIGRSSWNLLSHAPKPALPVPSGQFSARANINRTILPNGHSHCKSFPPR